MAFSLSHLALQYNSIWSLSSFSHKVSRVLFTLISFVPILKHWSVFKALSFEAHGTAKAGIHQELRARPHKAWSYWPRPAPGRGTTAPYSSPQAIVGVGLIVFHPHVVLLRSGRPLLRSPRIRPRHHVLGHLRGCGRGTRQSGRGPGRQPQPGRGGRAALPPRPRNHRSVAPDTPTMLPAPRSSLRLPAHPPAPPKGPPRWPGPPWARQPPGARGHRGERPPPSSPSRRRGRGRHRGGAGRGQPSGAGWAGLGAGGAGPPLVPAPPGQELMGRGCRADARSMDGKGSAAIFRFVCHLLKRGNGNVWQELPSRRGEPPVEAGSMLNRIDAVRRYANRLLCISISIIKVNSQM